MDIEHLAHHGLGQREVPIFAGAIGEDLQLWDRASVDEVALGDEGLAQSAVLADGSVVLRAPPTVCGADPLCALEGSGLVAREAEERRRRKSRVRAALRRVKVNGLEGAGIRTDLLAVVEVADADQACDPVLALVETDVGVGTGLVNDTSDQVGRQTAAEVRSCSIGINNEVVREVTLFDYGAGAREDEDVAGGIFLDWTTEGVDDLVSDRDITNGSLLREGRGEEGKSRGHGGADREMHCEPDGENGQEFSMEQE